MTYNEWLPPGKTGTGIGGSFNAIKNTCSFNVKKQEPPRDDADAEKSIQQNNVPLPHSVFLSLVWGHKTSFNLWALKPSSTTLSLACTAPYSQPCGKKYNRMSATQSTRHSIHCANKWMNKYPQRKGKEIALMKVANMLSLPIWTGP